MTTRRSGKEGIITAKPQETTVASSVGFGPVAREDARILILGSLPGQRSLQAGQYYAHPQNAFWKIMQDLTDASGTYEQRCDVLCEHRIALWDVLATSVRPGSMDADIAMDTAKANDFNEFFMRHSEIERVCFNGQKAGRMFERLVVLDEAAGPRQFETLPSTSPAYASMTYAAKLAKWRDAIK